MCKPTPNSIRPRGRSQERRIARLGKKETARLLLFLVPERPSSRVYERTRVSLSDFQRGEERHHADQSSSIPLKELLIVVIPLSVENETSPLSFVRGLVFGL